MKKQLVATFVIVSFPILFVSCVSSLLKDKPVSFSEEIVLNDPPSPFVRMNTSVFPSWKNTKTGNVISIVSDCSENSSYTLSGLHQMIESSLEGVKVVKEEAGTLQNRPAWFKILNAQLDGHDIEVQSVSFKRKSCGYVSSLSGKKNNLSEDKAQFDSFLNGFSFK